MSVDLPERISQLSHVVSCRPFYYLQISVKLTRLYVRVFTIQHKDVENNALIEQLAGRHIRVDEGGDIVMAMLVLDRFFLPFDKFSCRYSFPRFLDKDRWMTVNHRYFDRLIMVFNVLIGAL